MYHAMNELADDYELPHPVKKVIKATAEVQKYTYCKMMELHHGVVEAAATPIIGETETKKHLRKHPLVQYANFCK